LPVTWYSDIGNGTNWIRIRGTGGLVKFWFDHLNPTSSRFWVEAYIDPTQPPVVRNECYSLTPCYLHTRAWQIYYIKAQIMTRAGCSNWNIDP
jgi:hypothetical protein